MPLCDANGATVMSSACATAATTRAGCGGVLEQQVGQVGEPGGALDRDGRGRSSATTPFAASVCSRASTWSGEVRQGRSEAEQLGRDPHRGRRGLVRLAGLDAFEDADFEPDSTADACAPSSSDSAGQLGRRTTQPAVAQHRVDAVTGRRHAGGDALERGQAGKGIHATRRLGGRPLRPHVGDV